MTADQEPRDIEARLRASLNAYAEVVDERPARSSADGGGRSRPPSSPLPGWRVPVLVAAAVLAVAGGAWLVADPPAGPSPTAAPGSSAAESDAEAAMAGEPSAEGAGPSEDMAAAAVGPGGELVVPAPAEVGVSYPFDLYTHCGITGADVAGVWFAPDPPLVEEGGNPPSGWDNPYQRGILRLDSAGEAVFRDDAGHELRLRAVPEAERPPPCA